MCGIVGLINKDQGKMVSEREILDMCGVITHRGPDHTGIRCQGHAGIGMTRLSIIDRAGGYQPISNEDKTLWIVFNGEIYNFVRLRDDLLKKGHTFETRSDTETIIHLYEEYGKDCVKHLRGMFAFAIWDSVKNELFFARDRLGIKPMHYVDDVEKFMFASEIKSILATGALRPEADPQALVHYFFYGYTPDPGCLFKGVRKLPPGHYGILCSGHLTVKPYWNVTYNPDYRHGEAYFIDRALDIMKEAVKIRLVSEVPLGAFLSGGIDSSLVVALMAEAMNEPVKTFSIGFENQSYNELKYAKMVAERYGTDHHEEIVRPDAEEVISDLVAQFDEPFADSSAIPTYYVSRMTKKWVTVSLSGDGGDELFGGYDRYRKGWVTTASSLIPSFVKRPINTLVTRYMPMACPGVNSLCYATLDPFSQLISKYSKKLSPFHGRIFSKDFGEIVTTDPALPFLEHLEHVRSMDRLTQLQYLDTKTYLPGDILTKVDRTSMLVSLEARVPLLDHKLVEFAATIPPEYRIVNGQTKYLLKKIAEKYLPRETIYRPKQGFAIPVGDWIRKEWKDMSRDLVIGPRAKARGIFNEHFLEHIVAEHGAGKRDHSYILWTLMVLEMWFRRFIDG